MKQLAVILMLVACSTSFAVQSTSQWEGLLGFSNGNWLTIDSSQNKKLYFGSLAFFPRDWQWRWLRIGIMGTAGHFTSSNNVTISGKPVQNKTLSVFAFAPILRVLFLSNNHAIIPYVEGSVGVAYLTKTKFDGRNFGMNFTFEDLFGVGLKFNHLRYPLLLGARIIHYSNAGLGSHNRGITMPLMLYVAMQF